MVRTPASDSQVAASKPLAPPPDGPDVRQVMVTPMIHTTAAKSVEVSSSSIEMPTARTAALVDGHAVRATYPLDLRRVDAKDEADEHSHDRDDKEPDDGHQPTDDQPAVGNPVGAQPSAGDRVLTRRIDHDAARVRPGLGPTLSRRLVALSAPRA